ncbi:unnamed protein product [Laminaria digitata]
MKRVWNNAKRDFKRREKHALAGTGEGTTSARALCGDGEDSESVQLEKNFRLSDASTEGRRDKPSVSKPHARAAAATRNDAVERLASLGGRSGGRGGGHGGHGTQGAVRHGQGTVRSGRKQFAAPPTMLPTGANGHRKIGIPRLNILGAVTRNRWWTGTRIRTRTRRRTTTRRAQILGMKQRRPWRRAPWEDR